MVNSTATTTRASSFLGVEGGGSHTVCLLTDARGNVIQRHEAGPGNVLLLSDAQLTELLRGIRDALRRHPPPIALGLGFAGAHGEPEFQRIRAAVHRVWPGIPAAVTHDLETALASARRPAEFQAGNPRLRELVSEPSVLVLSGTGSCFLGKRPDGATARFGGWGHVIGDKGSGYEIGLRALKACAYYYDRDGEWSRLGARILRALQMNHPRDLIPWSPHASKKEIGALAKEVFAAWMERDGIARDILKGAAASLAKDAVACARKLVGGSGRVQFVFAGGVLLRQPRFARQVATIIRELRPGSKIVPLKNESAWGAVALAMREHQRAAGSLPAPLGNANTGAPLKPGRRATRPALPPTEARNPRSLNLDRLSVGDAINLMLSEDAKIPAAIRREKAAIEKAVRAIVRSFKRGGRLFYVGAGTSGRLGILDASECPPTFRTDPELVQGIIAGGEPAVFRAIEGAEDDPAAGADAIRFRGVTAKDVVIGIAASGRTPFVHGALTAAGKAGAFTALLCFNPAMKRTRGIARVVIAPNTGPEILTGSTRLKAGTATKLILNLFTTLAMVRTGKVMGNLMVDLNPSNTKLRDRAVRIVSELTGTPPFRAQATLEQCGWVVRAAVRLLGAQRP